MTLQVAVCGPAEATAEQVAVARRVGELLAEQGAVVICGGGGGVMAAAVEGARARGGLAVGVLPGDSRLGAHPDLSAVVVTGMGQARNAVIVASADAVIVVGGSFGTLSELALALRRGIRVVSMDGWTVLDANGVPVQGVDAAASAEQAVAAVCRTA